MGELEAPRVSEKCGSRSGGAFSRLGPGLVSGVADDDPSAIGTMAQVGASLGLRLVWGPVLVLPFVACVQVATSRIASARRSGLVAAAREVVPRWLLVIVFGPVVLANIFTLGADLDAMASALGLVTGVGEWLALVVVTITSIGLIVGLPYHRYRWVLMTLALTIFTFIAVIAVADVHWRRVADAFVLSDVHFDRPDLAGLIAVVGAIASPFVIVWHANSEVEEANSSVRRPRRLAQTVDVVAGLTVAVIAATCVMIVTATVLPAAGITKVQTVDQVARGLEPLLGNGAEAVFSLGIIGVGMLAVPVLAIGAAYVVSQLVGWQHGLGKPWRDAPGFYLLITGAALVAVALHAARVPTVRALYFASIANGLAVPLLFLLIAYVARSHRVMGHDRVGITVSAVAAAGGLIAASLPIIYLATA